jgi:mannose-1-phosphate guanylyltransferase
LPAAPLPANEGGMIITPVLLSGGAGTRLWPMSRNERPKQFLPLTDAHTMFELTLLRIADRTRYGPPLIVAGADHADLVAAQLAAVGLEAAAIILEPCARNTGPAIALAALAVDPDELLLIMPSDHVIAQPDAFARAVDAAQPFAEQGWLVTFGITPTAPETGYGYIAIGTALGEGVNKVAHFVEKPHRARAEAMLASGDHVWNGGIFLMRAGAFLDALQIHAPEMLAQCRAAMGAARRDGLCIAPDGDAFASCPSDSIDYAVLEKTDQVAVVPVSMGWSDVGSWDALYELGAKDGAGNASSGEVILVESGGNLVRSDGLRIALAGVSDLIVIANGNDVLIVPRGEAQRVKQIVTAVAERASVRST